jgi:hypothetical protein
LLLRRAVTLLLLRRAVTLLLLRRAVTLLLWRRSVASPSLWSATVASPTLWSAIASHSRARGTTVALLLLWITLRLPSISALWLSVITALLLRIPPLLLGVAAPSVVASGGAIATLSRRIRLAPGVLEQLNEIRRAEANIEIDLR